MQYLSFSLWLISHSIMPSGFIHIVANGRISFFLRVNSIPLCVYIFFIFSSFNGHWLLCMMPQRTWKYRHLFKIVISLPFICTKVWFLGHMIVLFFLIFKGSFILLFIVAIPIYNSAQACPFLYILTSFDSSCFFDSRRPNRYEVIFPCGFNLHITMINDAVHHFMYLLAICMSSLEKCLLSMSLIHF